MKFKTEKIVENMPPYEAVEGVDWASILERFDPTQVDQKYIDECASKNRKYTCYNWSTPPMPIEDRLSCTSTLVEETRSEFSRAVKALEENFNPWKYGAARKALIRAVEAECAHEYNKRVDHYLSDKDRREIRMKYRDWEEKKNKPAEVEFSEYVDRIKENKSLSGLINMWFDVKDNLSMIQKALASMSVSVFKNIMDGGVQGSGYLSEAYTSLVEACTAFDELNTHTTNELFTYIDLMSESDCQKYFGTYFIPSGEKIHKVETYLSSCMKPTLTEFVVAIRYTNK